MKYPPRAFQKAVGAVVCLVLMSVFARGDSAKDSFLPWPGKPVRFRLTTGMDCVFQRDASSALTAIQLFVAGGKSAVPAGKDGLAYLASRLALEIPDESVVREIMSQATRMRVSILEDASVITLECLSENLEEMLRVASRIIQEPLLSGQRIDRGRKIAALEGQALMDDAAAAGHAAALSAFFGGKGRGGAAYGTEESLKDIEKKDITAFYRSRFTRSGILFAVCSDVEADKIRGLLEEYFAALPEGASEVSPAAPPYPPAEREIVQARDTQQSYVGRAYLLPFTGAGDYARGCLLEVLVGSGPGSRLWDLRATERLAYGVGARTTWTGSGGVLEAFLETDHAKRGRAVEALNGVLNLLHAKGVTEDELAMTKAMAISGFLRANEVKSARARTLGLFEGLGLGADFLSGIFRAIEGVSVEELNAFIDRVLDPGSAVEIVVGPARVSGIPCPRS
jgi:zinc protease